MALFTELEQAHLLAKDHLLPLGLPTELDPPEVVSYFGLVALETLDLVQEHPLVQPEAPFHRLLEALVEHLPE
jgi:hypothetical protein